MAKSNDTNLSAEIVKKMFQAGDIKETKSTVPQINVSKRNINVDNGEIITTNFLLEVIKKYDGGKYITIKGYFNLEDNPGSIYFADILNFMDSKGYQFVTVLNTTDNRFVYGEILFKKV